jgi:dihydrofolate reductase
MIAAVGRNGVIGNGPQIPWHLPEDFRFFSRTTMGHVLVMGRRTFESIGRALPGRRIIVVTRQLSWSHPDVELAHSLEEGLAMARSAEEIFVAGGGEIYAEAMPLAERLLVTEVDLEPEGDVFFPQIDASTWKETARDSRDGFSWVVYERRTRPAGPGPVRPLAPAENGTPPT